MSFRRALIVALPLLATACPGRSTPAATVASSFATAARPADASSASSALPSRPAPATLPALGREEICARTPVARAVGRPGVRPFTELDAHCPATQPFCDTVDRSPDPRATCFVANDNLSRAERESRQPTAKLSSAPSPAVAPALAPAPVPAPATRSPKYLDRIDAHLHLTREERGLLDRNGFVVLDRLAYRDYANAFHDVFQEQLPLFVSVDAIAHAVFRGTELALDRIERKRLVPALNALLRKLRAGLAAESMLDRETRDDLDVYLGVAAALLKPTIERRSPRGLSALRGNGADGNEAAIAELVAAASTEPRALTEVVLFGRPRMIDFSQLAPRGHYASYPGGAFEESLEGYFQAMMWLSRLELNLVSRSSRSSHPGAVPDPRETPREVKDALALAALVERTGAATELRAFDDVYAAFAGRREDVSPVELAQLARTHAITAQRPDATAKLIAAIGGGFTRTARTHFTPEGAPDLPVILTMFGPRIVPDVAPLTRLVHDELGGRFSLGAGDAGYVLGHDRARHFIGDLDRQPQLPAALDRARAELRASAASAKNVYGSWLRGILALAAPPTGSVPSFTRTEAYADQRLNSALVAYGQLRHAFVLLAAQGYDSYGCEIPDAYVEPLPAVFEALLAHVRTMRTQAKGWEGLERVLTMLAAIARDEVSGRPLTEPQRRWLGMVSEHIANGGYVSTGEPPKWTGWYFDLFDDREHGASRSTAFVADYFTLTNLGEVAYLGAEGPRLGVYVVDTGGEARAMVGPVAKGFEVHLPIAGRLDDASAFAPELPKTSPWRVSYAAPGRPDPDLGLQGSVVRCGDGAGPRDAVAPSSAPPRAPAGPGPPEWRVAIRSRARTGWVRVTLLDHHGDPITAPLVLDVGDAWQVGVFELPSEVAAAAYGVEALHVHVDDLARSGAGTGAFDVVTSPSVFRGADDEQTDAMPARERGVGAFHVGE